MATELNFAQKNKWTWSILRKAPVFIFLFLSFATFSQNVNLFEEGKEHYRNGKYQQAIDSWNKIIENGQTSPELYFNLGNAQYKLNQIGPSIYYYEKALQLSPNDPDIKTNLAFAENARIDLIEPLPQSVFTKWYHNVADTFTFDGWAVLTTVFSIVSVTFFLLYYFSYSEKRKRLFFTTSLIGLFLMVGTLVVAYLSYDDFSRNQPAIIFANEVEIRSEPSMGGNAVFILHEGTKVQITDQDGNWYRISLADGKDGWIPATDLKQL